MAQTESGKKKYIIGVASGLTVVLVTRLVPWLHEHVFSPCVREIQDFFVWLRHHLASSAIIPWWLLWILILLSFAVVFGFVRIILRHLNAASLESLKKEDFREFEYEGLKWIWKYDPLGRIASIVALCPNCLYELDLKHDARPNPHTMIGLSDCTIYYCDHCKVIKGELDGSQRAITMRVHKEIVRLYNTGEWKNIVRRQLAARSQNKAQS